MFISLKILQQTQFFIKEKETKVYLMSAVAKQPDTHTHAEEQNIIIYINKKKQKG